eukprot:12204668-Alexandrium_andersonii.AAC.2
MKRRADAIEVVNSSSSEDEVVVVQERASAKPNDAEHIGDSDGDCECIDEAPSSSSGTGIPPHL